jgi:hypothetical protein
MRMVNSGTTMRFLRRARRQLERPSIGYALLALSVIIALFQVYFVYYNIGDEGDSLTTGWLVADGWVLYKDIFSHHFPFSYLWIAIVVKLFGASLLAIRLSLVLLRTVVLAIAMRVSGYTLALGLAALGWSLVGHLYLGNEVLYQSFSGIFIVGGFAIGLSLLAEGGRGGRLRSFVAGLFLGVAMTTDPLMTLPSIVLMFAVTLYSMFNGVGEEGRDGGGSFIISLLFGILAGILPAIMYLLLNDSLGDFYQNAILFNSQVYSKYAPPITLNEIIKPAISGLGILDRQWRYYLSPFFEWTTFEFIDRWVFIGLLSRLSVVLVSLTLLLERRFISAIFGYLFGAMVLVRSETFFHASPFKFLAFFCICWLIGRGFRYQEDAESENGAKRPILEASRTALVLSWVGITTAFIWLGFRGGKFLIDNASKLSYSQNFDVVEGNAGFLTKVTCDLDDAYVLIYPLDPIQYFLSEIPPASKYHFLTPWVAEVGQGQAIDDLSDGMNLVYLNRGTSVWGYQVEIYLADLITFLDKQYVQIEPNYYASRELLRYCPYEETNY